MRNHRLLLSLSVLIISLLTSGLWATSAWADLSIATVTVAPETGVVAGDSVTLQVEILNSGEGAVETAFDVDFSVDGEVLETHTVDTVLEDGSGTTLESTWTAVYGEHTLDIAVDTGEVVAESDETNNTASVALPSVGASDDELPPEAPTNLVVTSGDVYLTFEWDASANSNNDLIGYNIYFDGDTVGQFVDTTVTTYTATGLQAATG